VAFFEIYGLNNHELMPLGKVFKKPIVEKTEAVAAEPPIDVMEHTDDSTQHGRQHLADQTYRTVEQLPNNPSVLLAEQVMTSPVLTLAPEVIITEALEHFQFNAFRHVPVVSSVGRLVGIVSDRDILRYLAGVTESHQRQFPHASTVSVEQLMIPRVLVARIDTDVRYIARLFVEQHIGAMPVVSEGKLAGIITRSDVLKAVVHHYTLEWWV